jgi:hypothetical protein
MQFELNSQKCGRLSIPSGRQLPRYRWGSNERGVLGQQHMCHEKSFSAPAIRVRENAVAPTRLRAA